MNYAVEMLNINKEFPGVIANNDVTLRVKNGAIHGVIGENGAGKSTLMNILYGLYPKDRGDILINGKEVDIRSPHIAIDLGIGMVHQHFMLVQSLTVWQNIILGNEPKLGFLVDKNKAKKKIREIIEKYSLLVDMEAKVYQLSVGERQRVEIIKALYRGARIMILDEPTAVLTPQETIELMSTMRQLSKQGCSIIFITHKLKEVMAVTSEITVMCKGKVTGNVKTCETDVRHLAMLMIGRDVENYLHRMPYNPGEIILELNGVKALNERGLPALNGVSFELRSNEILGIAGVEGNGQTELVEVITGMEGPMGGKILFKGIDITSAHKKSVRARREMGMSHIPEDRLKFGTAKECTIQDNIILNRYYQKDYCKNGVLNSDRLMNFSQKLCKDFSVKTPDSSYKLSTLSGGNMQKVILAREIETNPDLLIAAQPTRGVDIGAIEFIHQQILSLRDQGKAILLVSAELDEIFALADRVIVLYEGEVAASFSIEEVDENTIGLYMTGAKKQRMIGGGI